MIVLDVRDLKARNTGPRGWLLMHEEATSVMMMRFHPESPTKGAWDTYDHSDPFPIDQSKVEVYWDEPTVEMMRQYGNSHKNTERAAEGIAIAIANHLGFNVVGETFHSSGSDLLLIPRGEPDNDFYKVEVSGIGELGTESPLSRLHEKVAQALKGQLDRPGMAIVVRFADMRILSEGWR